MTQKTRKFVIALSWQQGQIYQIKVFDSPAGDAEGTLLLPFSRNQFLHWAKYHGDLPVGVEHNVPPVETPLSGLDQFGVGVLLYRALFQGEVKEVFERARVFCEERQLDLRIVMRFETQCENHLAAAGLPWELMCDPNSYQYLCLQPRLSLVRYLEHPHKLQRPPMPAPLKILAIISNPKGDDRLTVRRFDTETVKANLCDALRKSSFELHVLEKPTLDALFGHLVQHDYDVLHFVGHGGFIDGKGGLLFENEAGFYDLVDDQRFARALVPAQRMRLVHLVSCNTGVSCAGERFSPFQGMSHALVGGKMTTVVAMQFLFRVKEAGLYCETFYDRIADGEPLDKAVDTARLRLSLKDNKSITWATPVVFLRDENAHLFQPPHVQRVHLNSYEVSPKPLAPDYENQLIHHWYFQDYFELDDGSKSRRVIYPEAWFHIKEKLESLKKTCSKKAPIHFEGNCMLSIWFSVGHYFSQSTGYQIACRQNNYRKARQEIWRMRADIQPMELNQKWGKEGVREEMIVSVNCTGNEFEEGVRDFVADSSLHRLPWLQLTVPDPSRSKLRGEADASALVHAVANTVRGLHTKKIHLFLCVPSAVALFLGREVTLGKSFVVYDYQSPGYAQAFIIN